MAMLTAVAHFDGTTATTKAPTCTPLISSAAAVAAHSESGASTSGSSSASQQQQQQQQQHQSPPEGAQQALQLSAVQQQQQQQRQPVKYSAFGAAVSEVELDVLTGERRVLYSHIVYDCGKSLNPGIDLGQIEGAFVMGLGAMLCEQVQFDEETGELLTGSTWNYKVPTHDLIPQEFIVNFLADAPNSRGILSSKASGEPALMTSTSALMALQQAAQAAAEEVQGLAVPGSSSSSRDGSGAGSAGMKRDQDSHEADTGRVPVAEGGSSSSSSSSSWRVLAAPATPQRLKAVVSSFSIADALEAALQACSCK
jgi:hypothetical protein